MANKINVAGGRIGRRSWVVIAATLWAGMVLGQTQTLQQRQAPQVRPVLTASILAVQASADDLLITVMWKPDQLAEYSLALVVRDLEGNPVASQAVSSTPGVLETLVVSEALAKAHRWGPSFSVTVESAWAAPISVRRDYLAQYRCDRGACAYRLLAGRFEGAVVVTEQLDLALQEYGEGSLSERVMQISTAYPHLAQESSMLLSQADQVVGSLISVELGPGAECVYAWQVVVGPASKLEILSRKTGPDYVDSYGRSWAFAERGGVELGLAHCVSGQAVGHPLFPALTYAEDYLFDGYLDVQMDLRLLSGASCQQSCASSVLYSVTAMAMIDSAVDVLGGVGTASTTAEESFTLTVGGNLMFSEEILADLAVGAGASDSDLSDLLRSYSAVAPTPFAMLLEGHAEFQLSSSGEGHAFAEMGNGYQVTAVGYPACGSPSANVILESADFATLLDWDSRGGGIKIDRWERGP